MSKYFFFSCQNIVSVESTLRPKGEFFSGKVGTYRRAESSTGVMKLSPFFDMAANMEMHLYIWAQLYKTNDVVN